MGKLDVYTRVLSILSSSIGAAILLTVPAAASFGQPLEPSAEIANLCEVMRQPAIYAGHRVSLRAIVLGEDTSKLLIMWPECQFGMHLVIPKAIESQADVLSLYKALKKGNPGTTDQDFTREFSGVFEYSEVGSSYSLVVEAIRPTTSYKSPT